MAHDFGSVGTVVEGVEASRNPRAHILPEAPRANFYLMHNPQGWEPNKLDDGTWEWLPVLKRLMIKPGVNGVRGTRNGVDDGQARMGYQDRGWTILPRDLGYITRYPCRRGYSYYLTWDQPINEQRNSREQIEQTTNRIVDSSRQHGQNVDRAAVRERVRQSTIRNEREKINHQ